jgi:two-component system sensor histidine kinase KdpD
MKGSEALNFKLVRFGISVALVLLVTSGLVTLGSSVNLVTVSLSLLLIVLALATFFGRNPALLASFVAMLCFNYFFIPPVRTWHIAESQNLFAWAAFTLTALIAGELSAYAQRRAREAERLYEELQGAFPAATEAAALKQSEKLKSALLEAVTHDLRTPLTSIKAAVTTLLDSEGGHRTIELNSEGRAEFLAIINEETDRLNAFIEGMVQIARVEAGSASLQTSANVEEIVAIALERAESRLAAHHLVINLERELPLIRVDATAMAEALYNLIDNAVKYSESGTTITITAGTRGDNIVLEVMDEGRGIPDEMRGQVFEKFVRLDDAHPGGIGLGLSIVRGIVEAQNGKVDIMSGDGGKGTKVIIVVPKGCP